MSVNASAKAIEEIKKVLSSRDESSKRDIRVYVKGFG